MGCPRQPLGHGYDAGVYRQLQLGRRGLRDYLFFLEDLDIPPKDESSWFCWGRQRFPREINLRGSIVQIPLDRIQKLSVHLPPAGTLCKSGYLPSCARLAPLMIVESGSKQMNSRG